MLTKEQAEDIFNRIRKLTTAQDVEAIFHGGKSALTRFANSVIHQNVAEESYLVSVRTQFGGRTARASTNKFDDDSLRSVVSASERLAEVQHEDSDLLPMPTPSEAGISTISPPSRYFEATAQLTPEERAGAVSKIVRIAEEHKFTAAGIFANTESVEGIFSSRGVNRWHRQTSADMSITMIASDASGWQKANVTDVSKLDPERLARIAAQKAKESAHPREVPPGKYTVIMEPAAVLDIVGFMFSDFGGLAILDQRSFLNNRVGKKLFGTNINIWDDVDHPLQAGPGFDGEGVNRKRLQLVEKGEVKRLVFSRGTAEKIRHSEYRDSAGPIETTGHGFPVPNEMGEAPLNIVFGEPDVPKSVEQMISGTERGILVTRFWYIREVEPYKKIMTGMTRDGTFYIENGRIKCGVKNLRFNESLLHMLSNVREMSHPVRASGEESFDMVAPAMKVDGFNFTEVTKF